MRLVLTAVLLVVELFGLLTGVALGLFAVEEVKTLGLKELVHLGACDTCEHLLGELVTGSLALGFLTLLVLAHGDKARTESNGLVRELGLVLARVLVVCFRNMYI